MTILNRNGEFIYDCYFRLEYKNSNGYSGIRRIKSILDGSWFSSIVHFFDYEIILEVD